MILPPGATSVSVSEVEVWKAIAKFPGYEVSTFGRVLSYWRPDGRKARIIGTVPKILKPGRHKYGYAKYTLVKEGIKYDTFSHTLVLETFVGPRPQGHVACHGENGVDCNYLTNLSWGTQAKNCGPDKVRDGTAQVGEKHGCARFTETDIRRIRGLYRLGIKQTEIAKEYKTKQGHISDICLHKVWQCVPDEESQ